MRLPAIAECGSARFNAHMGAVAVRRRFRVLGRRPGCGFSAVRVRAGRAPRARGLCPNDGEGVVVEAEGEEGALDAFAEGLRMEAPPSPASSPSWSSRSAARQRPLQDRREQRGPATALIPPDTATCEDCLRELFDPADRRYRYPFVNCTQCGPRFTIVRAVPYDRREHDDGRLRALRRLPPRIRGPRDRRFHAEPNCCPACGPRLLDAARGGGGACCATGGSSRSRGSAATTSPATRPTRTRSRGCGRESTARRSRSRC